MPLFGQDSREQTLNHWVEKEGNGIGKEPRDGIRNRVSASAVALYVDALTMRALAPAHPLF